jgi:hypothetical protein
LEDEDVEKSEAESGTEEEWSRDAYSGGFRERGVRLLEERKREPILEVRNWEE